ncbi:MAG: hypothetical protein HZB16_08980 [Armatimonadetes bacterium]|nr:hypothetical protein [Armatimonadota bacterium]
MTPAGSENQHWVFRVDVADRAGAVTSIASAFSNRGISIETLVGHGAAYPGAGGGAVVVTFFCSREAKDEIVRVVQRLSKVISLQEHPYDSDELRKSGLIRVSRRLAPTDVAGREAFLTCELVRSDRSSFTYFVAGSPSELDPIIGRLAESGVLVDIVYAVIGA